MSQREVVLHIGMGKTGSSALQVAFVRNRRRLAGLGIDYPEHASDARAERGDTVSGNGEALAQFLFPPYGVTDAVQQAALQGLLRHLDATTAPTVLYSSEFLYYFNPARLRELHDRLADRGVRLRVVLFVRDYAGLALSSYAQRVKRQRYTGTATEYITEFVRPVRRIRPRIEALFDVVGRDDTVVLRYDSVRESLTEALMAAVFGQADLSGWNLALEPVNRSLTAQETEWMRYLNTRLDSPKAATIASDEIMRNNPVDPRGLAITRHELALLDGRYGAEVAWANERLPGLDLKIDGGATVVDDRSDLSGLSEPERFLLDALAELANAHAKRPTAATSQLRDELRAARRQLADIKTSRRWRAASAMAAPVAAVRRRLLSGAARRPGLR